MKQQGVSIIICCHNGANRLAETIRHIARQRVPAYVPWELILVDNGSSDDSAQVARLEWQRHRVDTYLKVIKEPVPGLSHARARGFQEARYEYVVMCDDDNWLEDNYIVTVYELMSENQRVGALGGLGKLAFEVTPPSPDLAFIFAAGPQAAQRGKVPENKLYGAGCVIRHSAYENLRRSGFRSMLVDRRGTELSSGGDYELCLALSILGYEIWYDDRLRFTHFITRERLTWPYFERYALESSRCFNVITSYKLVASRAGFRKNPWMVMFRNFLICSRFFAALCWERLLKGESDKALCFRYLHFRYKFTSYLINFRAMVEAHRAVVDFERSCSRPRPVIKPLEQKEWVPSFRLSFFSKPSRQLP